ncbi:beta-lactamase-like protein [Zychaea mexicana]|uniref:beta-lactamase-like protein n=1 Tax=Zychaea mexicana TaxID=64656 RepID=UPI0022FE1BED|nr:beta-lactamase-like protein [Zychaea mexicana]KAI9498180.1 beta-lactamase-like protein [Zychaea mexicana]
MVEPLVSLPTFTQLSKTVWRVLGLNPGKFTLQGTNTYLLGAGAKKLLIDSGQGIPEYIPLLHESLQKISPDAYISDIIITHSHPDHFGGLKDILGSSLLNKHKNGITVHKFPAPILNRYSEHQSLFPEDVPFEPLSNGEVFKADSVTLRVVHTPGHTKDHCTFFLEEENSLFTADCVLGQGTPVFEDLHEYLLGLRKLVELNPTRLYPGHGPVIEDGVAKLKEYISHRELREKQLVDLLTSQEGKQWTSMEVTTMLYKDYPESLHLPAARGIMLILQKLEKEGKAKMAEGPTEGKNVMDLINKEWSWIESSL